MNVFCFYRSHTAIAMIALLGGVSLAYADTFEDANRAFAAGHYSESVHGYQSVLQQRGQSAAVLFNLANAETRLGNSGQAILDYQRAKWLAPHRHDIAANLRFAQKQAGVTVDQETWSERAVSIFGADAWTWIGSIALWVLCAGILMAQFTGKTGLIVRLVCGGCAVVLFLSAIAIIICTRQLDQAVLIQKGTAALISPFDGAKPVFEFPAGETVQVERVHANFSFVRAADGHAGWVGNNQVTKIVPG